MKNIVIIGGSSGIGLALIQRLTDESIVNISRTPCAVAGVESITADVTNRRAISAAFERIRDIDTLVYCAGTSLAAPVEYVDPDDYRNLFDVNILGAIECIRLAMPKLKKSKDARILLLASAAGVAPIPFDAFYDASKAALLQLSYAMRLETPDIKTTAVIIGGVRTRFSFKRKVYDDCGDYGDSLKAASNALIKIEQTGYDAAFIAHKLHDILLDTDPPPTKAIGIKNKLTVGLYGILPWRLKLFALRKMFFG